MSDKHTWNPVFNSDRLKSSPSRTYYIRTFPAGSYTVKGPDIHTALTEFLKDRPWPSDIREVVDAAEQ